MRYFYVVIEGAGVKGAKFIKANAHPLSQPLLTQVLGDFGRAQSLRSGLVVEPGSLFVSWCHELPREDAATVWPKDFPDQTGPDRSLRETYNG